MPERIAVRARDLAPYLARSETIRGPRLEAAARSFRAPGFVFTFNVVTKSVCDVYLTADERGARAVVGPRAGYVIPPGNPLRSVVDGRPLRAHIRWRDVWNREELYFVDAVAVGDFGVAILSSVNVWDRFHAGATEGVRTAQINARRVRECCGQEAYLDWCASAKASHTCSACGSCVCTRVDARSVVCKRCHLVAAPQTVQDGLCEECRV